jgi:hypothetical protein
LASAAQAANYSNEVLAIGVGARALGMGGAYVGIADDSTATYWNPAGLPKIKHMEVAAVQQGRQDKALALGTNEVGSQYFFMSGGMSIPSFGSLGVALMRFGVDGIDQIPNVTTCSTCPPPSSIGKFGTQDLAFLLSYGRDLHPAFSTGLTFKYMTGGTTGLQADPTNNISGNATYNYMGADLGMLVKFGGMTKNLDGLTLGINLQDAVNSKVNWSSATSPSEPVDMNAKVGVAYSLPFAFLKDNNSSFTLAVDADPKYSTLMHYGAELWYKEVLAFRGGMRQFTGGPGQGAETSIGASFKLFILQADYAFINYELTPIHYMSLLVRF